MDTSTKFYKSADGWNAKDVIDLGPAKSAGREGKRELQIHTYKCRGGINTFASCVIQADGCTIFAVCGDYGKRVAQVAGRCTEKSVKELHATVMAQQADAILAEARAFYEAKDAAKAMHAKRDAELASLDANPAQTLTSAMLGA